MLDDGLVSGYELKTIFNNPDLKLTKADTYVTDKAKVSADEKVRTEITLDGDSYRVMSGEYAADVNLNPVDDPQKANDSLTAAINPRPQNITIK